MSATVSIEEIPHGRTFIVKGCDSPVTADLEVRQVLLEENPQGRYSTSVRPGYSKLCWVVEVHESV